MVPEWLLKWSVPPQLVMEIASSYNLDEKLVMAMVQQESSGGLYLTKYEPPYRWLYHVSSFSYPNTPISYETEEVHQKTSWGPLHVMGAVARELGYKDELPGLIYPRTGLEYGCKHFRYQIDRYGDTMDALAAYNGGHGAVMYRENQGMYRPDVEKHVDGVMGFYRELGGNP